MFALAEREYRSATTEASDPCSIYRSSPTSRIRPVSSSAAAPSPSGARCCCSRPARAVHVVAPTLDRRRLAELAADGANHARRAAVSRRTARHVLAGHRGDGRPRDQRARRSGPRGGPPLLQRRRRPGALHLRHAGDRRPRAGDDRDRQQRPVAGARALDQGLHRDAVAGAARRARRARGSLARARRAPQFPDATNAGASGSAS